MTRHHPLSPIVPLRIHQIEMNGILLKGIGHNANHLFRHVSKATIKVHKVLTPMIEVHPTRVEVDMEDVAVDEDSEGDADEVVVVLEGSIIIQTTILKEVLAMDQICSNRLIAH